MTFYLLSMITGILECGWIFYGVIHGAQLWEILCYPMAYHIGNLFPKPISLGRKAMLFMSIYPVCVGIYVLFIGLPKPLLHILTCSALACASAAAQSVRSELKSDGNRLKKRIFRVAGFAVSPIGAFLPEIMLIISSALIFFAVKNNYSAKAGIVKLNRQGGFSAVMIFHQLHYFFYAHITLAAVSIHLRNSMPIAGIIIAALIFCGTWITYMSVEPVVSRLTSKIQSVFLVGHIGIGILLGIMSFITGQQLFMILWLITGFGGGVVYTISKQAKLMGYFDKSSMTIAENIGHTLGILSAVIVSALYKTYSLHIMLICGCTSAFAAVQYAFYLNKGGFT